MQQLLPAICVMGPTASGKTSLAMAISEKLPCELINVDSAQVYRHMNIGTAKLSPEELQLYPHRLIDIREPDEPYSASEFRKDALAAMQEIFSRGRIPLLVGGTMLYFRVLQEGLADLPASDQHVRDHINQLAEKDGWVGVHRRLLEVDPESAHRLHVNDTQRLQRALEVYLISGKTLSELQRQACSNMPFLWVNIALHPRSRECLHERIARRCQGMFDAGFIDEVKRLFMRGDLGLELPSMRSVGYRQVWKYLQGDLKEDCLMDQCVIATRQLAKHQLTWLRSWSNIWWLDSLSRTLVSDASSIINRVVMNN